MKLELIFSIVLCALLCQVQSDGTAKDIRNIFTGTKNVILNLISSIEKNTELITKHETLFEAKLHNLKQINTLVMGHTKFHRLKCLAATLKSIKNLFNDMEKPLNLCRSQPIEVLTNFKEILDTVQKYGLLLVEEGQSKLEKCHNQTCIEDLVEMTKVDFDDFSTRIEGIIKTSDHLTQRTVESYDHCTQEVYELFTGKYKKIISKYNKC